MVNVDCGDTTVKTGDQRMEGVETILKAAAETQSPEANTNVVVPATAVQSPTVVEAAKPQLAQGA